jgi:DNA-directed RNA polymerase subunit M/transcription elongation factor TFIIS
MKFCPCGNLLANKTVGATEGDEEATAEKLLLVCRTCGYQEEDTKGGLVLEINLEERTSEGYKILLNEFTKQDPTLPHVNTIKCPSGTCPSNAGGAERDVIYLKYDAENLKFLYICNNCDAQWKSKSN